MSGLGLLGAVAWSAGIASAGLITSLDDAPPCPGTELLEFPALVGELLLQPVYGAGVAPQAAAQAAESAAVVWRRYGLVVTVRMPIATRWEALLGGEPGASAREISDPLREAARELSALASPGATMVVTLPNLVAPDSVVAHQLSTLRGLTVPAGVALPTLGLAAVGGAEPILPAGVAPVVFLADLPQHPRDLPLTPAHELGHALGLAHRDNASALMRPGVDGQRCLPGLSLDERRSIQRTLEARGAG